MKRLITFVCFCFSILPVTAQINHVLNGGFEQYSSCPTNYDQIRKANYWQPIDTTNIDPRCSPEFCHTCAGTNMHVGIPHTEIYDHYPRSGNGMTCCLFYFDESYFAYYARDYTQGTLHTHLIAGASYCLTFYVTLAQASMFAVNRIGAYLDDGSIDALQDSAGCALPQTSFIPQVYTTAIINDTLNWVKIQGNYTANGTERFITIGNFFDIGHTDTVRLLPETFQAFSFYLIDDVSIIASDAVADAGPSGLVGLGDSVHIGVYEDGLPCTWYILGNPTPIGYGGGMYVHPTTTTTYVVAMDLCNGITYDTVTKYVCAAGVSALSFPESLIQLYPNPATSEVHIDHVANCDIVVYDMAGRAVLSAQPVIDNAIINMASLSGGVYMVQIADPATGTKVVKKLVKN